jgi:hypothetical protein
MHEMHAMSSAPSQRKTPRQVEAEIDPRKALGREPRIHPLSGLCPWWLRSMDPRVSSRPPFSSWRSSSNEEETEWEEDLQGDSRETLEDTGGARIGVMESSEDHGAHPCASGR